MTRSCGMRIGPRRYELVVLDGSAKKHKITAYKSGEFTLGGEDPVADAIAELKAAAKDHNIARDNVYMAIDTGHAAFRTVTLPITDRGKIEQVVKYEVEGELPQWNIDDVVIDFHVLHEAQGECELLVTALPKADERAVLEICERAGIEPLEVELETTAMFNAAAAADLLTPDEAQLLVHVGEHSTSVVVVDGGALRDMRVIHLGALTYEPVRRARPETEAAGEGEPGDAAAAPEEPDPDPAEVARRVDQAIKRIRRELGRTLSAAQTTNPIAAIHVCGLELPGLAQNSVLDVPVYVLQCFDQDLDTELEAQGDEAADGALTASANSFGGLVVAYGTALRGLGAATIEASLRREELRYTGKFERIEFPLAVTSLLLCFFLGVVYILQFREKQLLEDGGLMPWLQSSNNFMIGQPEQNKPGRLSPAPDDLRAYARLFEAKEGELPAGDPERTLLGSLGHIHELIQGKAYALKRDLGQVGDVTQPQSAFTGMCLVLEVLHANEDWRPSLRRVHASYIQGRASTPDTTEVTLDLTFFASDVVEASEHYDSFESELKKHPWYVDFERKATEELPDGDGIHVKGLPITVNVDKYYELQVASDGGGRKEVKGG